MDLNRLDLIIATPVGDVFSKWIIIALGSIAALDI